MKILHQIYAIYCYLIMVIALVAFFLFFENIYLPTTVSAPLGNPISINVFLLDFMLISLFGIQHSIMARDWFKNSLKDFLPPVLERVTFLLMSSITLAIIVRFWQPFGGIIWDVRNTFTEYLLFIIGGMGGIIVFLSAQAISSRSFIGWEQITTKNAQTEPSFVTPSFYRFVRHPIYFGLLLLFWSVPLLSFSGLFFNLLMTLYIIIGATFEERNLRLTFGEIYQTYQRFVPMLIPFTKFR
ncbi:MAG: methyltransferase family protein [Saprospiraceae bacterium]